MKQISYWLQNARIVALPQSILPSVVAFCLAIGAEGFSPLLGVLAIFGVLFAHLSVNLFDDYFDYRNEDAPTREQLAENTSFVRIAKSPYLYSGEVSPRKLFFVASLFAVIALLFGSAIFVRRGIVPFVIAAIAGFLGFFYSAKPLMLCYRGLGELVTGLIFGPLLMGGVYFSATGTFSAEIWAVSIAVGLFVTNILFTHSIMDYKPDLRVGKKTLAGVLKSKRLNLAASVVFNFGPYIVIVVSVICKFLSPAYLFTFLALPRSIYLFYLLYEFYYNPGKKFGKRWWLGPMENWKIIGEHGMVWFAVRWYLSRNILQLFCLITIVVSLFI